MNVAHQRSHVVAGVVAGDVGVEVSPGSFDAVVVGAVRRQKVELETLPFFGCETDANLFGVVDGVVIQNDVDRLRGRVALNEFPQQQDEQQAVLLFAFHADQFAGLRVLCAAR